MRSMLLLSQRTPQPIPERTPSTYSSMAVVEVGGVGAMGLRSDDVLQYLPKVSATSFAGDASPSVVKATGPKNTLGGKGERALSFFVAKPDAVVQTETISPQYDTVRKAAPTAVFGSAPRPSICDAEPDDRCELHVSDTFVRYVLWTVFQT